MTSISSNRMPGTQESWVGQLSATTDYAQLPRGNQIFPWKVFAGKYAHTAVSVSRTPSPWLPLPIPSGQSFTMDLFPTLWSMTVVYLFLTTTANTPFDSQQRFPAPPSPVPGGPRGRHQLLVPQPATNAPDVQLRHHPLPSPQPQTPSSSFPCISRFFLGT
jgi:hypothetical protein